MTLTEFTDQQLLDLDGVRRRSDRFEWDLVAAADDAVLGQLHPRRDHPPVIRSSSSSGRLGRTLTSFQLPASDASEIDLVRTALRPYLVLATGTRWPLGVFRWAKNPTRHHSYGTHREFNLVDRTTILDQEVIKTYSWKTRTTVTSALRQVLREVLPADQFNIEPSSEILYAPLSFPIGTSRLTIVADLLLKLGYLPAHFDHTGVFQARATPDPNLVPADVTYTPGSRVVAGTIEGDNTLLDTPNQYLVHDPSGNGTGIRFLYKVPATAPHSEQNRGYPVPMTKSAQGLSSKGQAGMIAVALAVQDGKAYEFRSFRTLADPRHDSWSVVDFYASRWLEIEWALTCAPAVPGGNMSHLIRQVYTESWVPPA